MKHLKTYESYEDNLDAYTNLVKEICYELEDEGYDVKVDSSLKVPSWAKDYIKQGHTVLSKDRILDITISKKGWFIYDDIKEICDRLIEALGNSSNWSGGNRQSMRLEKEPIVSHYWQSNSEKGEPMILFPDSRMMFVKKIDRDIVPSKSYTKSTLPPTKESCLKSEIILKFR